MQKDSVWRLSLLSPLCIVPRQSAPVSTLMPFTASCSLPKVPTASIEADHAVMPPSYDFVCCGLWCGVAFARHGMRGLAYHKPAESSCSFLFIPGLPIDDKTLILLPMTMTSLFASSCTISSPISHAHKDVPVTPPHKPSIPHVNPPPMEPLACSAPCKAGRSPRSFFEDSFYGNQILNSAMGADSDAEMFDTMGQSSFNDTNMESEETMFPNPLDTNSCPSPTILSMLRNPEPHFDSEKKFSQSFGGPFTHGSSQITSFLLPEEDNELQFKLMDL